MATEKNSIELYFEWWLNELKEGGFVKWYKREPFPILVTNEAKHKRYNFAKKKPVIEEFNLLGKNTYTCDYIICWEVIAKELFFNILDDRPVRIWCPFFAILDGDNEYITLADVKPTSGGMIFNNSTAYTFPIIQKILYSIYGIFINKAIPIPLVSKGAVKSGNKMALFTTTFVPKRYMLTDGGSAPRAIHYKKQSLKEYVTYKTKEIDKINAQLSVQKELF